MDVLTYRGVGNMMYLMTCNECSKLHSLTVSQSSLIGLMCL